MKLSLFQKLRNGLICSIVILFLQGCEKSNVVKKNEDKTANLTSLSIVGYEITPAFSVTTLSYSLTVENDVSSINISMTPSNGATITVNGSTFTSSGEFTLEVGINIFNIQVKTSTNSQTYQITVTRIDVVPVADAGVDQSVAVGETVILDASGSNDPNGDLLSYDWMLTEIPDGSTAELDNVTALMPQFQADEAGNYVVELIVNDGANFSAPDTISVSTVNTRPVANAGDDQTGFIDTDITLDGTASTDVDGDSLTYSWLFTSIADGSSAVLSDALIANPTFTMDIGGNYIVELIVSDGELDSVADEVQISTINSVPVADAGTDQTVLISDFVTLDGSGSFDADGDNLSYLWSFSSKPLESVALLADEVTVSPSFTVDKSGAYSISLVVNDGKASSSADMVLIATENSRPVADAGVDQTGFVGDITFLDGSGSVDADNDLLKYQWSFASTPNGSVAVINNASAEQAEFTSDLEGPYVAQLIVSDASLSSTPDTSLIEISVDQSIDTDGDGLSDTQEIALGTDPNDSDSDDDGLSDGDEVNTYGTSPTLPDTDNDGASDFEEVEAGTSPTDANDVPAVIPDDPASVAPALKIGESTSMLDATSFLYTGSNPIQKGVVDGTIVGERAAVIRGKVVDRNGNAVSGVKVAIFNHPEYGYTATRTDGVFDIAVNGGYQLTLDYKKTGLLSSQRNVKTLARDYVWAPEIVMIGVDPAVKIISFNSNESQIAKGTMQTDLDGDRQSILLFKSNTTATLIMPDGSMIDKNNLSIRSTEYTVGLTGPASMPGDLPFNSGYTYAVELSADEAIASGATRISFNKTVYNYVDNFLDFPSGTIVPNGFYDRSKAAWIAEENGLVIDILSINNGLAELDVNNDGLADSGESLLALSIDDDELAQLATLYTAGQSIWRMPLEHFTPHDYNFPYGPAGDSKPPMTMGELPIPPGAKELGEDCTGVGSIIGCVNQTLAERIPVTGAPFNMHYQTNRVEGYADHRHMEIPIINDEVPDTLISIEVFATVAGNSVRKQFEPVANQKFVYDWDGFDGYGRKVSGPATITMKVIYNYQYILLPGISNLPKSFGEFGDPLSVEAARLRNISPYYERTQTYTDTIGPLVPLSILNNGWSVDQRHVYSPIDKTLYLGNGSSVHSSTIPNIVKIIAGNGEDCVYPFCEGGDGTALGTPIYHFPEKIAVAPDGTIYMTIYGAIRKFTTDGLVEHYAGYSFVNQGSGDEGPDGKFRLEVNFSNLKDIVMAPDGGVTVADWGNRRIRHIDPDGMVRTIAGKAYSFCNSQPCEGVNGPATEAFLGQPTSLAYAADGSFYFTSMNGIDRVGTDGILTRVAGTNLTDEGNAGGAFGGDGGLAINAQLNNPRGLVITDNAIYFLDSSNARVRKIDNSGIITTVVEDSRLLYKHDMTMNNNGSLIVTISGGLAAIDSLGTIERIAGVEFSDWRTDKLYSQDNRTALSSKLDDITGVVTTADNELLILSAYIRKISPVYKDYLASELLLPSADGNQLYRFNASGRHLQTLNSLTGKSILDFGYDSVGNLISVTDGDNNQTVLEYDTANKLNSITAPGGQQTTFEHDVNNNITSIINPLNEKILLTYKDGNLLESFTDPNNNTSQFTYDDLGRLTRDVDSNGGYTSLIRVDNDLDSSIVKTTAMGRQTIYKMEYLDDGSKRSTVTGANGENVVTLLNPDGRRSTTYPGGRVVNMRFGPDPRFGMQVPILEHVDINTPAGLIKTIDTTRIATLTVKNDPLSIESLVETTRVNGKTMTSTYDSASKTYTRTSAEGRQVINEIDDLGRTIRSSFAVGVDDILKSYDAKGNLTDAVQGDYFTHYNYDQQNRMISLSNAEGNQASYQYDNADRVTMFTRFDGQNLIYDYDLSGNKTGITMPGLERYQLNYTSLNLSSGFAAPGETASIEDYDVDRVLKSKTLASGRTLTNNFDSENRWVGRSYPEATVGYIYNDGSDRLFGLTRTPVSIGDAQQIDFAFDADRITQADLTGAVTATHRYTYDDNFYVTNANLSTSIGSLSTNSTYDNDGLIIGYGPFTISRDGPGGATSGITDNSLEMSFVYDSHANLSSKYQIVNAQNIFSMSLTKDKAGRIVQKTETIGATTNTYNYVYDSNARLSQVTKNGNNSESYSYDVNDNRITANSVNATYDQQDRIISVGSINYNFDKDGYLTSRGGDSFVYSAIGELINATTAAGDIIYSYDGHGRRVSRTDSSGTTKYLYGELASPFRITSIIDENNKLISYYYDDAGLIYAMNKGGVYYYIATDQVGTPKVVSDSSGSIVKILEYNSFGQLLSDSDTSFDIHFGYAGGLEDKTTGLIHFVKRDYDPSSGRWTARDPVLYSAGQANLYSYVGSDPINFRDPFGLWCVSVNYYHVVGGGAKVCNKDGKTQICTEGGIGFGGGVSVGEGKPGEDGNAIVAEGTLGCGPATIGLNCQYDKVCGNVCKPITGFGDQKMDGKGRTTEVGIGGGHNVDNPTKCGFQGKAALVGCGTF